MRSRMVEWQLKDRDLLEIIRCITGTTRQVDACNRKHGTYYRLRLQGQTWVNEFKAMGVQSRKTFTCRVPDALPPDLRWHFLRGVIDGDGNIYVRGGGYLNKPGYKRLSVSVASGGMQFLDDIKAWAGGKTRTSGTPGHVVHKLEWDCGNAWDLLMNVYADSDNLRLERKFDMWRGLVDSRQTYRTAA